MREQTCCILVSVTHTSGNYKKHFYDPRARECLYIRNLCQFVQVCELSEFQNQLQLQPLQCNLSSETEQTEINIRITVVLGILPSYQIILVLFLLLFREDPQKTQRLST